MITIQAVDGARQFAHDQAQKMGSEVKGAIGNDLIQIVAVVGFIALFGSGIILGLEAMADAVEPSGNNTSQAYQFVQDSIGAFDVVPGLLEVIVVFGFVAVLIGLLWYAMGRMGLGQRMRGGL
ncbi:MAG: hypothetical protein BRC29_03435 [Nanohaloarchaea archaeon SW_7_43_1]|nr:MAG: hypothetical protein BRC29_03435 [Nanohaloarchaea archaeon SW_7_43_1]